MLLEANEFVRKHFAEKSRPSRNTLTRWLNTGQIAGARKIGGKWYVDERKFNSELPALNENNEVDAMVLKILNNS